MMSALKTRLLLIPALFLSLPLVLAQAPTGDVNFYFNRSTYPVWDFSGSYSFSHAIGAQTSFAYGIELAHDLSGSLHGKGTTMVSMGGDWIAVSYTASGRVALGGNSTKVSLSVHLTSAGLDSIAGQNRNFSATLSYNLRVDPNVNNAPALIAAASGAPVRGSVHISGLGSSSIVPDPNFSLALPQGVDGSWFCSMNLLSVGKHIGGTGTVTVNSSAALQNSVDTSTSRVMTENVSAGYKAAENQAQAVLSGLAGSRPSSLHIYFAPGATQPSRMSGKLLGQTVKE